MESQSRRWNFFRRSKKKKKKDLKDWDAAGSGSNTAAVSCGTSTGVNNNNHQFQHHQPGFYSQSSLDENGSRVPAYLQPHPRGYLSQADNRVVHRYDVPQFVTNGSGSHRESMSSSMGNIRNSSRHESTHNVSNVSNTDSAAAVTCLQRSRSQPSVTCSPKKSRKEQKESVREGAAQGNSKKSGGKGLGAWLRRSLKRSKSKNDVAISKDNRRELQDALDAEEYTGGMDGTTRWNRNSSKLTRSVSTSMVNSSHSSSLGNLVSTGLNPGLGRVYPSNSTSPLSHPPPPQLPIRVMHTSPVRAPGQGASHNSSTLPVSPRSYILPPQTLKHSSLPLTPSQQYEQEMQPMSSSIGVMRAVTNNSSVQGINRQGLGFNRQTDSHNSDSSTSGPMAYQRRPLPSPGGGAAHSQRAWPNSASGAAQPMSPASPIVNQSPNRPIPRGRTRSAGSQEEGGTGGVVGVRRTSSHGRRRPSSTPNSTNKDGNVQYQRTNGENPPPLPFKSRSSQSSSSRAHSTERPVSHNQSHWGVPHGDASHNATTGGSSHLARRDGMGTGVRPASRRSKTPESGSRSSNNNSRSASRSSDCPSGMAPTPPVPHNVPTSPGRGPSPGRASPEKSTAFVLIGPQGGIPRALDSPAPSLSLASSVVSSVGVRRASRELPPLPPKRHSLASTVASTTTASESVYHQINDANVVNPTPLNNAHVRSPGAPWSPPTVPLHSRTNSAELLERSADNTGGGNDSRYGRRAQALLHQPQDQGPPGALKRAASQSVLDDMTNNRRRPSKNKQLDFFFSQLDHVRSACDLTMITEDKSTIDQFMDEVDGGGVVGGRGGAGGANKVNWKSRSQGRLNGSHPRPPPPRKKDPFPPTTSTLKRRSKSHHDLLAFRTPNPLEAEEEADTLSPRLSMPSRRGGSGNAPMQRYRSQPDFGGPGIQSRESLAFKPLSNTTSDSDSHSLSSSEDSDDSDQLRSRSQNRKSSPHRNRKRKQRRRRPKRRSASYNNIRDVRDADDEDFRSRGQPAWPTLQRKAESSYMLKRWWATLDDIPTAVLRDGKDPFRGRSGFYSSSSSAASSRGDLSDQEVSMATTASYIPGVSLADKLRLAASKGQIDKVKELIAAGANFSPDREGRTALHYAALNGYANVVSLLAAEGCEIDFQDTLGYTALHRAAAQGHLEVVRALLAEGCLVDRQDEVHGNAAIHEAAWNGYSKTLELLVKQRSHVNITNKAGFSALHLAAQNGHNQSARVMLYSNTNPDHKNNYGDTPLHTAARYGHAGVTRILCSAKANVNEQNKNGDTALHIAAALKRRKITKLLCDSPIDVNIRNKQNETAVDVARRKEHPEVILIVTSKPKVKDKKGRFGKSKGTKVAKGAAAAAEGEKKEEKRGFFFRRKKAKEKIERSNPALLTAASEVSSTHYNPSQFTADMPASAHLVAAYRDQQARHQGACGGTAQARGTSTLSGAESVTGVMHQYANKQGIKYYRDLAGNIKQGPVGFTPQCSCAPLVKRLETRVEADRANLYDHIDASHRTLGERLEHLDRRTAQQVYSIDKLTKERLEAERKERTEQLESRALAERLETERQLEVQQDCIRTELKAWVDARLTGFERQYTSHDDGCDYLLNSNFNFGRDGLHQTNLFRSRSDETLSVSSSHPKRKGSKAKARAAHELKKMQQDANGGDNGGHRSNRTHGRPPHGRHNGLKVHDDRPTGGEGKLRTEGMKGRPLGHSPEGQSTKNDSFTEAPDRPLPEWIRPSPAVSTPRHFDEAEGISYNGGVPAMNAHLHALHLSPVVNESQVGSGSSMDYLSISPSHPNHPASPLAGQHHQDSQRPFTILAQVHHAKTDSGSNPDSGYGGKPYNQGGLRLQGSEQHDVSIATNSSITTDGTSGGASDAGGSTGDPLHVTRHFFDTVSAQMEKWYERRLKEVEKKTEDRVKQESSAMQSRIRLLEERFGADKNSPIKKNNKVRLGPQIEASIGTQV